MNKDKEFFDGCAANWDKIRDTDSHKLQKLVNMIKLQQGDNVLDVGTGTGVLLPYLLQAICANGHITAVDFSEKMLEQAKLKQQHKKNIIFEAGDIMELELSKESFNAITGLNFYPHLHNRKEEFLKKMLPLLKKGGTLTIFHDISREQVNSIHAESKEVREHKLPPADEVGLLLQNAGYVLVQVYEDDTMYFVQGRKA